MKNLISFVPLPIAIIISLAERVWNILGEIACALISLSIRNSKIENYGHEFIAPKVVGFEGGGLTRKVEKEQDFNHIWSSI